jgi:hypothetical protein
LDFNVRQMDSFTVVNTLRTAKRFRLNAEKAGTATAANTRNAAAKNSVKRRD